MVSTTDGIKIATATASNLNFADGVTITGDSVSIGGVALKGGAISSAILLTTGDSGTVYTVAQTSSYSIDLPDVPVGGIWYKFMIKTTGNFVIFLQTPSQNSFLYGTIINAATSVEQLNGSQTLEFSANVANIGDTIEAYGIDATTYMIKCVCSANGGIIDGSEF